MPVDPALRPHWPRYSTNGQNGAVGESEGKKEAHEGHKSMLAAMIREAAALPNLLQMRLEGRRFVGSVTS